MIGELVKFGRGKYIICSPTVLYSRLIAVCFMLVAIAIEMMPTER